jgi:hypothetical protein
LDREPLEKELYKIINISKNRVDLFFDAMQAINSPRNLNILIYLRALKYLQPLLTSPYQGRDNFKQKEIDEIIKLKSEIEQSIKSGMMYLTNKIKDV